MDKHRGRDSSCPVSDSQCNRTGAGLVPEDEDQGRAENWLTSFFNKNRRASLVIQERAAQRSSTAAEIRSRYIVHREAGTVYMGGRQRPADLTILVYEGQLNVI